ncbi:MAG: isoleucine--tRNA ligase [Faecalibacterium sp.]|nr:isoleucine--tRNA ligase [Faecalibacterium sp.]
MRAGLPKKEPVMLENWEKNDLYNELIRHNAGKPKFVLHDGPPYANGNIHMGTAMNKIIKDMIIRYKNMSGFQAPYVPGYDTHGLPIELKALSSVGEKKKDISKLELRKICHEFATEHIGIMNDQFKRLGVIGDFEHPYLTLKPEFEARQIEIFGEMAKKGYIYKGMKPVYWCPECRTALAEAEIEYADDACDSIFVRFQVTEDPNGVLAKHNIPADKTYFLIWTTTTWTLPANEAICLNASFAYSFVKINGEYHIMATELVKSVMDACHITDYEVVGEPVLGSEFELMRYQHVYLPKQGWVILGDHVTLESGSGCVHTAGGHGVDDFNVCQKYPQIPITVPVDDGGYLTEEAGKYKGLKVWDANKVILADLKESGAVMGVQHIVHSYPHCWRCHHPIIFRATEQWFCSVAAFRDEVYKAIDTVQWMPEWGHDRMKGMVRDRNDWCISRQRTWGVPIPAFYCKKCGKYHITDASIKAVSELFRKEGSDAWYKYAANDILPKTEKCACGASDWEKDTDIMDVWFDSGSTHLAVLEERPELAWPADLYMEGADQFRGWFQSSLLTSVAARGVAPYKGVLCHGWVVDEQGKQMHKSAGNGMSPDEITKDYGADIIRLWVASSDYTVDVRAGKNIFKQLSEAYRKVRNTARFILGNLDGFNPDTDAVPEEQLFEIDRWALAALDHLVAEAEEGYEAYNFSKVYHAVYNFCVVDLSNFYLDVIKDRLYCTSGTGRKAAQTAMYEILVALDKIIAPILCFTSQEIWDYMPKRKGMQQYVVFEQMPKAGKYTADAAFEAKWAKIMAVRDEVKKVLEQARADKTIGASLEAGIKLYCTGDTFAVLNAIPMDELADLMIVSRAELAEGKGGTESAVEGLGIEVYRAEGAKCERCWKYTADVGKNEKYPTLCARCAAEVEG